MSVEMSFPHVAVVEWGIFIKVCKYIFVNSEMTLNVNTKVACLFTLVGCA